MMRLIVLLAICSVAIIGAACAGGYKKDMSQGEKIFRTYCQTCHTLPQPSLKTDDQWLPLVQRYGKRAKLSQRQIELITQYLTDNN